MRLSQKQIDWWEAQPDSQTCRDCGKQDSKYYVQPQYRKGYALCVNCIDKINRRNDILRKAELDAMPRCEVPACKLRGTFRVGMVKVLLCGRHKNKAIKAAHSITAGSPMPWLSLDHSRADVLEWAQGENREENRP